MRNQLKTLSRQLFTQKHFICFQKQFLFSFNTIQYPHNLKNNIYHSSKRGSSPIFHTNSNPILDQFSVHSGDKTDALVVTVEFIWLLLLNILCFNFFLRLPAVVLRNLRQSYTAFFLNVRWSRWPRSSFSQLPLAMFICVIYFCWAHLCWNGVHLKVGKQTNRCEIVTQKSIKAKS